MITLDTSGLLAYIRRQDRNHEVCRAVLQAATGPYIIPVGILGEIAWMLESTLPPGVEEDFLSELRQGSYTLDWDRHDIVRVQQLIQRYQSLSLGMSDALVVACAERHAGRVLTTDKRHFSVVARGERTITVLPEEAD